MEKRIEEVWQGWKVIKKLGEGGFGAVYEIERDVFGKIEKAALKVISIPQSNDEIKEFYDEGYNEESIAAHYRDYLEDIVKEYSLMLDMKGYTNIVYCDDLKYVKHQDGIGWDIFIKMELLTPMLKTVNAEYGESTVINLAKDICQALEVCRNANIVHRDIKPQNIFVSRSGDYKLGDFGIAKISEKTQSGTKIGTFEYMAPEVYSGKPYGAAADIYSLGLVLYWMLNERRHPFISASTHIPTANEKLDARMRRLGGEALPAPVNGSDELKRIVLKACAFNAEDRYQSSAEMLEDLLKLTPAKGTFAAAVAGEKTPKNAPKQEENDKTVAIFDVPTQPEISNKVEGSEKTEVLKKKEPKVEPKPQPKPQPKPEPKKENKVDYKSYSEPRKEEKKNKKGILFAIIGVVAVVVIIALILLLRSCGEETPAIDESSEAVSEAVSEIVSETESSETISEAAESSETAESSTEEVKVMTYAEYLEAEVGTEVTVETYVQANQSWWYDSIVLYCQSQDGGLFVYNLACSEEDSKKLVAGTKICVTGSKAEYDGEVEIMDATFTFVEGGDTYVAEPVDLTDKLGTEELINDMNELVCFKGLTFKSLEYKNGEPGDDIYVTLTKGGKDYNFCVEVYLTGPESDVYTTVGALEEGDVVDVEGFLYWYQGANPHITKITVAE